MLPTKFQVNWLLGLREEAKKKKDFQDGHHGGHLGFPISRILAVLGLQVTLILPTKFGVNWPFGSGNKVKNRFSRWLPWQPSWISDRNDLAIFDLQVTPMLPTKFLVNRHLGLEEAKIRFSRWLP